MSNPDINHIPENPVNKVLTIEELMAEHYDYVCRLAYSVLLDRDDADDAAQETFIRASCNLDKFRGEADIRTWLYAIALNVCKQELRKKKIRLALGKTLRAMWFIRSKSISVEEMALQGETKSKLWYEVARLDEKHRIPVILKYIDHMTVPQIAIILGVREGTVHSRLHYARQKLFKKLENELGERFAPEKVEKELFQ
ncbi:MAG: RNA polymerase sigma factor [Anaerolineales bacterium]|nr:RNA polymerase sigma factor [Anaerolineales bacterium]